MLSPTLTTWRLVLHVLAAAVWVGGQFALASVVPTLRRTAPEATRAVARAFARVAWPAFAVLVVTGIWNLVEVDVTTTSTSYQITLFIKVLLAMVSGAAAVVHQVGHSRLALAAGGAIGFLAAVGAMFLGVLLRTGG
jgi:putative copper export protein